MTRAIEPPIQPAQLCPVWDLVCEEDSKLSESLQNAPSLAK